MFIRVLNKPLKVSVSVSVFVYLRNKNVLEISTAFFSVLRENLITFSFSLRNEINIAGRSNICLKNW